MNFAHKDANHYLGMSNGINTPSEMIFKELIVNYDLPAVYIDQQVHQIPELDQILMLVRDNLFQGVYVNVPWHEELVGSLENRDHSVIYTGQCNVIMPTDDGLKGYNTLVETISKLIDCGLPKALPPKSVIDAASVKTIVLSTGIARRGM